MSLPFQVKCPQCHAMANYEGNPFRPFCSERCRKIDLGTWASGGYAIPGRGQEVEESNVSREDSPEDSSD
ncbi:MAG TPA: DNA gyrase inhibitor YacG [bacterium]|nr:DNA gyrase inhibitor YacG [bacterium]